MDYVTKIHLFDDTYQSHEEAIDINTNLDLPEFIGEDRPHRTPASYTLKGRSINHLQQVEAHYAQYIPRTADLCVPISALIPPPRPPLNMYAGYWTAFPDNTSTDTTTAMTSTSVEPECYCDMRTLMSQEHPAGCRWLQWKRGRK